MFKKTFLFMISLSLFVNLYSGNALATCESCAIPRLGRTDKTMSTNETKPWSFDFAYEQLNWNEIPVQEAHELHEEGHDVHNKKYDSFYHFKLGFNPTQDFSILAQIPYVVRESIEIEDEDRLGQIERSEGIGDLNLIGNYRFYRFADGYVGAIGGVKFPTGRTGERNSHGERFESELQPGTGSFDYPMGLNWEWSKERLILRGNAIYVIKTEGDQDLEFGDLFSTAIFADWIINPDSKNFHTKIGLDLNFQNSQKQIHRGAKVADSGGNTLLLGPVLTIEATDQVAFYGDILFPVYQNLGGVHQKLDFIWNVGLKVKW